MTAATLLLAAERNWRVIGVAGIAGLAVAGLTALLQGPVCGRFISDRALALV